MSVTTTTHLNFRGDARAALEFYRAVFGGEIVLSTEADRVVWGQVAAPNGFRIMAYDVPDDLTYDRGDRAVFVSVRGTDADELTTFWTGLADGATVVEDLGPSAWSPLYGMLRDRFGVTWVLDVEVRWGN